jgi:hypothetical protein
MKPTIQTTTLEILQRHRQSLTCSRYVVNYIKQSVQWTDDNGEHDLSIDNVVESTYNEARDKGYNIEIIGGIYA